MKYLNIIVEGSTEEAFVNDVLVKHFASLDIFVSVRKIQTGWDRICNRPAKGGLLKYIKFRNDVLRWIQSDKNHTQFWYTSMLDLYAFPTDSESPYTAAIQAFANPYEKIRALESAIAENIGYSRFIPYVQLHEFEAFVLVDPDRLITMYPDAQSGIKSLKRDIGNVRPEEINESHQTAPSKRIIKYLPAYEGQKAQVGPLVAEDIGLGELRNKCPHFNEWITKLEGIRLA
ncbi:MAG TPA: DUF4276 family protein [Chitinophaga sp.]|uniref:DUF4276 family protein n=1 Tax=Chitinophaga sp. TaxID=1869181 RepID=UPI002CAB254D|nr:DUF4276 family protein [Chitinophaga sp.]HVI49250.1 DUF4276 family protein [Chitinophaga sp.]